MTTKYTDTPCGRCIRDCEAALAADILAGKMTTNSEPIACPHCQRPLTDDEIKRLWAQRNNGRRTVHKGGRPLRKDRCACGRFGKVTAKKKGHVCQP